MRKAGLIVALLLLTAGCVGSEDDPGTVAGEDGSTDTAPERSWETITRSGTVTGAGTPAGSISQADGNMASWTVPQNSTVLYLNITTEGGELSVEYGPDCNTENTVECEHSTTTEDGEARELHEAPNATGWEAYFFLENDAGEVDWELTATMGVLDG